MLIQGGDNMLFIYGLLTAIVLFLLLFLAFSIGQRTTKTPNKVNTIDEQEKQRIERLNKHFKELFAYDVDKALQRKKVT